MIMATEKYALNIDAIEAAVEEFKEQKPSYSVSLKRRDEKNFVYKIEKDDHSATLTMYVVKGGRMSHQVQGGDGASDAKSVGRECWEYVVEKTHINCTSCNFFTIKNVSEDDFSDFLSILSGVYSYTVEEQESSNEKIQERRIIRDQHQANVTLNYYYNKTLTIQGALTPLFNNVWIQCLDLVGEIEDEERQQFLSYSTTSAPEKISSTLSDHITNMVPIQGNKIDVFVETSIKLANLGLAYKDSGWICFCILKGLDALMSLKLTGGNPANSFERYSDFFKETSPGSEVYVFRNSMFDGNPIKRALEDGYTLFRKERNSSFHIDRSNIASSRTMSYDEAVDVIEKSLAIINRICEHW